mgnify:CR=1 FL=1
MGKFNWYLMVMATRQAGKRVSVLALIVAAMVFALFEFVEDYKVFWWGNIGIGVFIIVGLFVIYLRTNKELKDDNDE